MKKILLLLVGLLSYFSVYGQEEYEIINIPSLIWLYNADVKYYSRTSSELSFWNYHALTKENERKNTWVGEEVSTSIYWAESKPWAMTFKIQNLNRDKDSKYRVYDENGKEKWHNGIVYWGIYITVQKTSGATETLQIHFSDSKHINSNYTNAYYWTNKSGDTWLPCNSSPHSFCITYDGNGKCQIGNIHTFYGVKSVSKITMKAGPAAHVRFWDFEVRRKTAYGIAKPYMTEGDKKYDAKDYFGAAMEYGKAIDAGYQTFDSYYNRASAYYCAEFYNNAIDDYTTALQYRSSEEAYFYRGLAKLAKNDISGIEDLLKGGSRGQALVREMEVNESASPNTDIQKSKYIASGTGFFLDPRGFIVTNFHVIDGANNIDVFVTKNGKTSIYSAKSVVVDKSNDLAILKITDSQYTKMPPIPYTIASGTKDVGSEVYAMGYPELSYLGEELKVTDGIISSKTGYQGDVTTYQISAPIQHGNSGGPLFDNKGYLVGITNAGVSELQNVGYAIKVSYLNNLIDACPEVIYLPTNHQLAGLPLTDRVKKTSPYVVIIKVY